MFSKYFMFRKYTENIFSVFKNYFPVNRITFHYLKVICGIFHSYNMNYIDL